MADGERTFLHHWFEGLERGLERLPAPARDVLLEECARACGRSYTLEVFRRAYAETGALEPFLRRLEEVFPDASWERTGPEALRVTYRRCSCDLVTAGWVRSPRLCGCSAASLRENLGAALGVEVEVELVASILGGAKRCELRVRLPPAGR